MLYLDLRDDQETWLVKYSSTNVVVLSTKSKTEALEYIYKSQMNSLFNTISALSIDLVFNMPDNTKVKTIRKSVKRVLESQGLYEEYLKHIKKRRDHERANIYFTLVGKRNPGRNDEQMEGRRKRVSGDTDAENKVL